MEIINNSNKEFIYLSIPIEYSVIYNRIMQCLLESGIDLIKGCSCECKNSKVKIVFDCWFAFQSAIAAKKLGKEKEASLIIKYISAQLDLLCDCYNNENEDENDCSCRIVEIDFETGILKVETECDSCNIPDFYIDPNTGNLHSYYDGNIVPQNIQLVDNNLIQKI